MQLSCYSLTSLFKLLSQIGGRVLWEHTFLLTRTIAITDFLTFITNYIVTESDKLLLARVPIKGRLLKIENLLTTFLEIKFF